MSETIRGTMSIKNIRKNYYIGIMSGTSLDGVDVTLCKIEKSGYELISGVEYPFDPLLKRDILAMIEQPQTTLPSLGEIDIRLGRLFADAVNYLLSQMDISREEVEAIGSHGQTLWHQPNGEFPFSMQLGDPNTIAAQTAIKVVSDFRQKDIALGGEGAPLVPAFHQFLFASLKKKTAVVNIGGMANITVIDTPLLGYDTGCGNVLLDAWIEKHQGKSYDRDGEWASQGKVHKRLLNKMLKEPFFSQKAPKSTGREKFNLAWVESYTKEFDISAVDIQATLLELTAQSIANEVKLYDRELLLLCGGGAKNGALVARLRELLSRSVKTSHHNDLNGGILPPYNSIIVDTTDSYGVSSDYMEAMAFAWLAYKRIHKETVNLKDVTGARENSILGGVYE